MKYKYNRWKFINLGSIAIFLFFYKIPRKCCILVFYFYSSTIFSLSFFLLLTDQRNEIGFASCFQSHRFPALSQCNPCACLYVCFSNIDYPQACSIVTKPLFFKEIQRERKKKKRSFRIFVLYCQIYMRWRKINTRTRTKIRNCDDRKAFLHPNKAIILIDCIVNFARGVQANCLFNPRWLNDLKLNTKHAFPFNGLRIHFFFYFLHFALETFLFFFSQRFFFFRQ